MSEFTVHKATMLIPIPKELVKLYGGIDILDEIRVWNAMTPEQRKQAVHDVAQRDANEATAEYKPTCGDLLDMSESLWQNDEQYWAAGTYICAKPAHHGDGFHKGQTLQALADADSEYGRERPSRVDDLLWTDDDPNRRANR